MCLRRNCFYRVVPSRSFAACSNRTSFVTNVPNSLKLHVASIIREHKFHVAIKVVYPGAELLIVTSKIPHFSRIPRRPSIKLFTDEKIPQFKGTRRSRFIKLFYIISCIRTEREWSKLFRKIIELRINSQRLWN